MCAAALGSAGGLMSDVSVSVRHVSDEFWNIYLC